MKIFIIIVSCLICVHFLRSPSELEREKGVQLRKVQEEKEVMARNLLLVRHDISNKLSEIKSLRHADERSKRELEILKSTLEGENKKIRSSMQELSSFDSWIAMKGKALVTLADVKAEFSRVGRRMQSSAINQGRITSTKLK